MVLKIKKVNEKEFLYTVFFQDYGKLTVTKKKKGKEKPIDTGYTINCEIITKEQRDIHTIWNIQILHQFSCDEKDFQTIQEYLHMIKDILNNIPQGSPHREVFNILEHIAKNSKKLSYTQILLTRIKLKEIVWNISQTWWSTTVQKILKFIENHKIQDILKLTGIDTETLKDLEQLLMQRWRFVEAHNHWNLYQRLQ